MFVCVIWNLVNYSNACLCDWFPSLRQNIKAAVFMKHNHKLSVSAGSNNLFIPVSIQTIRY